MRFLMTSKALLALMAMLVVSECSAEKSHNLTIGSHTWGDHLLQREIVKVDWSWFRIVKKQLTLSGDGFSKISMIKAQDQSHNGKGAEVSLVAGGPGQTWATLQFKSQRSNPIDFVVEIYGK